MGVVTSKLLADTCGCEPSKKERITMLTAMSKPDSPILNADQPKLDPIPDDMDGNIPNYTISTILGCGAFGKVKLCYHTKTKEYRAIKIINKYNMISFSMENSVLNEFKILNCTSIKHEFIVKFLDCYQTNKMIYFIMEYIQGGEFFNFINYDENGFTIFYDNAPFYIAQVCIFLFFLMISI